MNDNNHKITYCLELERLKNYFFFHQNNQEQQYKSSSISTNIGNLNISYMNHVYFELLKEQYEKCKNIK